MPTIQTLAYDSKDSVSRRPAVAGRFGFTMVELLVAMVIFGVIGTAAMKFLLNQSAFFNHQTEMLAVRQNTRAALNRLSSDIRLVGQGLNNYDIQVPDLIVPNDGTVSVNTYTTTGISLISIPDPAVSAAVVLDATVAGNGGVGDTDVTLDGASDMTGIVTGARIILFEPNSGNSQVVTLTSVSSFQVFFNADPLVFSFPATGGNPSQVLKLNEVRFRVNSGSGIPFMERKVDSGNWVHFVEGISTLTFAYFDPNGQSFTPSTAAQRRDIRRIEITITGVPVRKGSGHEASSSLTLTSSVVSRNMLPAP
jgi:prepilin-type N-terminal cleavage/methylation domain-containing protein